MDCSRTKRCMLPVIYPCSTYSHTDGTKHVLAKDQTVSPVTNR